MVPYTDTVIFAIKAAISLGQKIQTVFEDETRDMDYVLPPVEGDNLPFWNVTEAFFENEGQAFVTGSDSTALYHEWWQRRDESNAYRDKLRRAHSTILEGLKNARSAEDVQGAFRRETKFYEGVNALFLVKQWRDGADPKRHPVQRIAGTVVEIGLDYVKSDPTLFSGNGIGERVTRTFLMSLDEVEFAESDFDDLLLDILQASLQTFRTHSDLIISEDQFSLIFKEISITLSEDIKKAQTSGDDDKLRALYTLRREFLQDIIKASAKTVGEHPAVFLGTPKTREKKFLSNVLKAVLNTVQKESDLFTYRSLADIYAASLHGFTQNTALILPGTDGNEREKFIENLIKGITHQLAVSAEQDPPGIFTMELLFDVIGISLNVTAANAALLINPDNPQEQLMVDALERVILGLSDSFHGNEELTKRLSGLFSTQQLVEIIQNVFKSVAQNPSTLLRETNNDPRRSALVQIIGSVAAAISADTQKLLNGENYDELLTVALKAFAKNPDRLLELDTTDSMQNVMAQVMTSILTVAAKNIEKGGRDILRGEGLIKAIELALSAVSKNVNGFNVEPKIVSMVMDRLLQAASDVMANELDSENLILAFEPILVKALQGRDVLDASDADLILPALNS